MESDVDRHLGRRRRWLRRLAGLGALAVGSGLLGIAWAFEVAGPGRCGAVPRTDLSLAEMGALKRKVEAMRSTADAALRLGGEEASFILNDHLGFPISVEVHGDQVETFVALPDRPGSPDCFHLAYRGSVAVDRGEVIAVPDRMVVGRLDLSAWVRGATMRFDATVLPSDEVGALLRNIRRLRVGGGVIQVSLEDVEAIPVARAGGRGRAP